MTATATFAPPLPRMPTTLAISVARRRYLLKLFRDYVFHQTDAGGSPIVDYMHISETLTKLDLGHPERITLTSRDGLAVLVVSYVCGFRRGCFFFFFFLCEFKSALSALVAWQRGFDSPHGLRLRLLL
jgi:hypothetical protein